MAARGGKGNSEQQSEARKEKAGHRVQVCAFPTKRHEALSTGLCAGWRGQARRVFSVKQTRKLDLGNSDRVVMEDKGVGVWREVSLDTLGPERIQIVQVSLCGIAEEIIQPAPAPTTA